MLQNPKYVQDVEPGKSPSLSGPGRPLVQMLPIRRREDAEQKEGHM